MKIGIITFHWATNYGAVLQCYALSKYLSRFNNNEVFVIDYLPFSQKKHFLSCFKTNSPLNIIRNLFELRKEHNFVPFRKKYLSTTNNKYNSYSELINNPPAFDAYVCGSDQVWNSYFTSNGEFKPTLSYFLDFGNKSILRIAYAVSFGNNKYPRSILDFVTPSLNKFNAISVREKTGVSILENVGFKNVRLVPDPTILLTNLDYEKLLEGISVKMNKGVFFYVLQKNQSLINDVKRYLGNTLINIIDSRSIKYSTMDIINWLAKIKYSKYVVTNSFHGVVFSVLFHTPFIAIPIEGNGKGMNDRIYTFLEDVDLSYFILESFSETNINDLVLKFKIINWELVEKKLTIMREKGFNFLSFDCKII